MVGITLKKVKMEMRRGGKKVGFQDGTYSLKKQSTYNIFLLDIDKSKF